MADPGTAPTDPRALWLVSAVTQRPVLRARPRLVYPDSLRLKGIRGDVVLEFVVDTVGHVERDVRVVSTDHAELVVPAIRVVRGAIYRPGLVRGRPVRVLLGARLRVGGGGR